MSASESSVLRKWVPMPGGSCNVRIGDGAIAHGSKALKGCVGKPHRCLVVLRDGMDEQLCEDLRRSIVDAGFVVSWHRLGNEVGRTIEAAADVMQAFARAGLTSADLCCAFGDGDLIALVAYVAGDWCGGVSCVAVPDDEVSFLEGVLVPEALDACGLARRVTVRPCMRNALVDLGLVLSEPGSDTSRHLRAIMVQAAMLGSERDFSALWDRAEVIAADDESATVTQLLATAKSLGQAAGSTAAAIRQSLDYGKDFAWALAASLGWRLPKAESLAEGMRFSARIAVMLDKLSLDDMLAQDELLETLGVGALQVQANPRSLFDALKDERLGRTGRFMLPIPHAMGRVRLTTVPDDLLHENLEAWCAAHQG